MENYLLRTGVTLAILDKMSVIHIAGTKGKVSIYIIHFIHTKYTI